MNPQAQAMARPSARANPKISPPMLFRVVLRQRLFSLLEDATICPLVWVSGPPGAGKTTLVASYLAQRKQASAWLRIDSGDNDPAALFHYLSLAVATTRPRRKLKLPLFGPEYAHDLRGFARRFFRQAVDFLPRPCALVLDNYQDADSDVLSPVVEVAAEEFGQDATLIVISRDEPGPTFTRLIVNQRLKSLGWDELRFTLEETRAFLAPDSGISASDMEAAHRQAGGWAAACVLVLEHQRQAEKGAEWMRSDSQQALFDYFASEIFNRATPDIQRFLVQTALLPQITERLAVQLTGNADAAKILDRLYRRNFFLDRWRGETTVYQYHALFRDFLRQHVHSVLDLAEQQRMVSLAADLLVAAGYVSDAVQLTLQSGEWKAAHAAISAAAPALLRTGRSNTLLSWLGALPPAITEHEPWLAYWHGLAKIQTDELAARDAFERAYRGFAAQGQLLEQLLCASVFVQALYSDWGNFKGLKLWTERIAAGFARDPEFSSGAQDLCASSGYLCVAMATAAGGDVIEAKARHVRALLESLGDQVDPNEWLLSAETLMRYLVYVGPRAAIEDLIRLAEPVAASDHVSLLRRGRWLRYAGKACYYYVSEAAAMKYWSAAKSIAQTENFSELLLELLIYEARLALFNRNLAKAAQLLPDIESRLDPQRPVWGALYHHVQCWYLLLQDEPAAALGEIHHAVQLHRQAETPESEMGFFRSWEVYALVELNRIAEAIELFESLLGGIHGENRRLWVTQLFRAYGALRDGDSKAGAYLEEGLRLAREGNRPLFSYVLPYVCRLCTEALRLDIESDHVKRFIRERKMLAPAPDSENWPWPVKIFCLGRFGVLKDDLPIRAEGKAQRKPLELLKVLIALGGRDVPADKLIDEVWPEPLEGGGQKALDITIHRLRKMLDSEEAIQLSDRRVTLNPQIVWVDLWALERALETLVPAVSISMPDIALLETAVSTVLDLYRGAFLAGDEERPWRLTVQSRLSARFQRFALRLGAHFEAAENWDRAAELYRRASELEPLAEAYYRRLMVSLASQGQRAEAIQVFRRCRQMLSLLLNVKPTAETEAVYQTLLAP